MNSTQTNVAKLPAVKQEQLINLMNVLHFQDGHLLVILRHKKLDYVVQLHAYPEPSQNERIQATWLTDSAFPTDIENFELQNIIIPGAKRTLEFFPENCHLEAAGIYFSLPDNAYEVPHRRSIRHLAQSENLQTSLIQNSVAFPGQLLDFSPASMRVRLYTDKPQSFSWINPDAPATVLIKSNNRSVYSGTVNVLYRSSIDDGDYRICILEPLEHNISRFRPKKFRTRREAFKPSPDLIFDHPLTGRHCTMKVETLGSLGFSVTEPEGRSSLLAGLLIPEACLSFANSLCLKCTLQVVHTSPAGEGVIRCGIAILDIKIDDHLKLISLIQQAEDENSYISNQVNLDDLFEFFFETGFIYPKKYIEMAHDREAFKEAYRQLYSNKQDIARHFVYQDRGQILGHVSALNTHRFTWLNHHHAAIGNNGAGLKSLRLISEYINDSYFLNPANLKYIIGFYRPENRFPEKFFGGLVRQVQDKSVTSIDAMSYISEANKVGDDWNDRPGEWQIMRAQESDIIAFRGVYNRISGGLMANAFDIYPDTFDDDTLAKTYEDAGLKRQRYFYAIRHNNGLKALVEVQDSALGLNMSELTNAILVYVVDEEAFHETLFRLVVFALSTKYNKQKHPVLVWPADYTEKNNIEIDKTYNLWALNLESPDVEEYMNWIYRYTRKLRVEQ